MKIAKITVEAISEKFSGGVMDKKTKKWYNYAKEFQEDKLTKDEIGQDFELSLNDKGYIIGIERDDNPSESTEEINMEEEFNNADEINEKEVKEKPKTQAQEGSIFSTLNKIEAEVHKKGPQKLNYISWADAWTELKKAYPEANMTYYTGENGMPYFKDASGGFVKVGVTIGDMEHISMLPIMDHSNKSVAPEQITSFAINKALQRALTKAIAMHGLGLYVYRGEDLPEDSE